MPPECCAAVQKLRRCTASGSGRFVRVNGSGRSFTICATAPHTARAAGPARGRPSLRTLHIPGLCCVHNGLKVATSRLQLGRAGLRLYMLVIHKNVRNHTRGAGGSQGPCELRRSGALGSRRKRSANARVPPKDSLAGPGRARQFDSCHRGGGRNLSPTAGAALFGYFFPSRGFEREMPPSWRRPHHTTRSSPCGAPAGVPGASPHTRHVHCHWY